MKKPWKHYAKWKKWFWSSFSDCGPQTTEPFSGQVKTQVHGFPSPTRSDTLQKRPGSRHFINNKNQWVVLLRLQNLYMMIFIWESTRGGKFIGRGRQRTWFKNKLRCKYWREGLCWFPARHCCPGDFYAQDGFQQLDSNVKGTILGARLAGF